MKTSATKTNTHPYQTTLHYNIKLTKKLKPGLVASHDLRPGNGMGLF